MISNVGAVTSRTLIIQRAALAVAIVVAAAVLGYLLLTPVSGEVLLLLTAREVDSVAPTSVDVHSAQGWMRLGSISTRAVPKAPETAEAFLARVPVGTYDRVRLAGVSVPVALAVQKDILNTLLVGISGGRPMLNGAYGGTEAVSLGLNELSGQLKALPPFKLVDQFGRPFTNENLVGHPAIIAAFHTTCHTTCPLYTGLFVQLQHKLPSNVLLIEVTTAPQEDSPEVLRQYAGRVGASWIFLTGAPADVAAFWAPFTVQLSDAQLHSSTLAVIDGHGYFRTLWQGVPDVGGTFPPQLVQDLNANGLKELASHGNGWGVSQVLDSLRAVGGLAAPSSSGQSSAADFTLETLDGKRLSLADFRGRPVLINFWATYCAPCRREMPLLERTAAQHPRLVVLLIDERDSHQSASTFVAELKIKSTVLFDGDGKVGDAYGISGLPTTFFIRPDGGIEGRYIGETNAGILGPHISAIGA